jgi:predicted transcriptional regulator
LEEIEGLDKLFFELASESRLEILRELLKGDFKMQELARKLDMTSTETFRQLNRLSEASLIGKNPEGSYTISPYGRLVLHLSPSLGFAFKHKDYLLTHDIWKLPPQFISRIGELSHADLILDTLEGINRGQQMFARAENFAWGMAERDSPEMMKPMMEERLGKGVKFRILLPEGLLPRGPASPQVAQSVELRGIPDVPAIVALNEREAALCLRFLDGRMDYAGFYGDDQEFLGWARDLFIYYWDRAKRI